MATVPRVFRPARFRDLASIGVTTMVEAGAMGGVMMSDSMSHPEDVSAADWVEQQEDADPIRDEQDPALSTAGPGTGRYDVDEADLAEQQVEVFLDEEQ
jgi:hypothetical protein